MPFTTKLAITEYANGSYKWKLTEELVYHGKIDKFVVPVDFVTDFASVPRPLWGIFPPYGKHTKAAVVHDYLYVTGNVSRKDADGIFSRMMRENGVKWRRPFMWTAVRLFGWIGWRRYRSA